MVGRLVFNFDPVGLFGSGGWGQVESLQAGGAGAVEGPAGPPGAEPDEVDRGRGGVVFEAGFGQAEVAGVADAGDVGGLGDGAFGASADGIAGFLLGGGLGGAGGGDRFVDVVGAQA